MPVPGQRLSLSDLAAAGKLVLATYAAQLEAQGVTVPGRRYVTPGSGATGIVWDGEQLNVAFQVIHQGQPGATFAGTQYPGAAVLFGQWHVLLLRKITGLKTNNTGVVSVPSAAQIDKDALTNLTDVGALAKAALQIHSTGRLNPVGTGYSIDEVLPMGPEGGLVGARLLVSISLT